MMCQNKTIVSGCGYVCQALMFTCSKHVIVSFPQRLIKVNRPSVSCQTPFVLSQSSGTLSSLEFDFPKWLHTQEACGGVLVTTS